METSGQGLANKAMARAPALPSQPVANLSLLVQRAQTRQLFPVQTSPSQYPMWCFRLNRVEKSPWPHLRRSSPFVGLYLGDRWPYRLQSTTARCVFVQTIQPIQLNGSIRHEVLEAASPTPFCLSIQCIKLSPVMAFMPIMTYAFLSPYTHWSIIQINSCYHLILVERNGMGQIELEITNLPSS